MAKQKRKQAQKAKPCDRCTKPVTIRYRVQHDKSEQWQLLCPDCWHEVSPDNPHYRYGGTWKAK